MSEVDHESRVLSDRGDRLLGKAMRLLDIVVASRHPRRLRSIVEEARLPQTTVFRVLQALKEVGLVTQTDAGYESGARVRDLAMHTLGHGEQLRQVVMPYMISLYERIGLVVRLAVLDGGDCFYLASVHAHRHIPLLSKESRRSALATASGRLLLVCRDRQVAVEQPDRSPGLSDSRPEIVSAQLSASGAEGAPVVVRDVDAGMVATAVRVGQSADAPLAALEVVGPAASFDVSRVLPAQRLAAQAASWALKKPLWTPRAGTSRWATRIARPPLPS